jgi:hypothetical protein
MTIGEKVLSWIIGMDGAFISAVALWIALQHLRFPPPVAATVSGYPTDALRSSWQKAMYSLSYTLAVILLVVVAIWDVAHPMRQFPYAVRMAFTLPVLALGTISVFNRLWRKKDVR